MKPNIILRRQVNNQNRLFHAVIQAKLAKLKVQSYKQHNIKSIQTKS